ncbi:hypothetical protein BY458DRAFT_557709 [Sporodiniella umbellata]|nr:hypothetical protein BY458DRAFT_557709 [Sporodiniella umbellata]
MSQNNRRVITNTRTVNYSPGGLNERFANLSKGQGSNTTIVSQRIQTNQQQNGRQNSRAQEKSVFSRLKATQPMNRNQNVQQRLGKMTTNKKGGMTGRITKPNVKTNRKPDPKKKGGKDSKKNEKKKPLSADDLDRSLDAYMMKDPKTAQAKLDAELSSYMSEAPMEEDQ